MQISLEKNTAKHQIRSYRAGEINIDDVIYHKSLLVSAQSIREWAPQDFFALTLADLEPIITEKPELILLGTGPKLHFPSKEMTQSILLQGIGFEVMDTAAACRTFTILTAEDRHVVAALIIR